MTEREQKLIEQDPEGYKYAVDLADHQAKRLDINYAVVLLGGVFSVMSRNSAIVNGCTIFYSTEERIR